MNLSTALVLSSAILGGSLLVSNMESQMTSPPAIESHAAAAPAPKAEPVAVTDLPFVLTATSTCTCANCKCKTEPAKAEPAKAAPLYTQPAPVAKPKAAPRPVVRYYYVQPRQQGGCSNGSCGSGGRRGLFGRRR
jgi:hypothetical protein